MDPIWLGAIAGAGLLTPRVWARLLLSRAKHRSLLGHPRTALRLTRALVGYDYGEDEFFHADGADDQTAASREQAFRDLAEELSTRSPKTLAQSAQLEDRISDVAFVNAYRVPFQFRRVVQEHLRVGAVIQAAEGARVRDLDGNWAYDLGGSYGVNVFGVDFYKGCIDRGASRARETGPVLGPYHPVIGDNVDRLRRISGMDEVSFHMSGTEAVMQAVRLARYHTGRSHLVRFAGAYHGWSDNIQAGPGNPRPQKEVYTLTEMGDLTLKVLKTRKDIACVLINPLQALNPNKGPSGDSTLLASDRASAYDKDRYAAWLQELRQICTDRGIVLISDEVFLGFRLALGGAQEFFGFEADMVTYGKTLGGGLPVGVLCGKRPLMQRFREDRPADICFARGTFNSHPYVMCTMNEFLRHLDTEEAQRSYRELEPLWNGRAETLNARLAEAECPVRVANMTSVWTTLFTQPGRYNWMLQYYLCAEGLALSWIGTGRFIFSHVLTDADFQEIVERFVRAATRMKAAGWWLDDPSLTNKSIKRGVVRELLSARLGRRRSSGRRARLASGEAETCGTS